MQKKKKKIKEISITQALIPIGQACQIDMPPVPDHMLIMLMKRSWNELWKKVYRMNISWLKKEWVQRSEDPRVVSRVKSLPRSTSSFQAGRRRPSWIYSLCCFPGNHNCDLTMSGLFRKDINYPSAFVQWESITAITDRLAQHLWIICSSVLAFSFMLCLEEKCLRV